MQRVRTGTIRHVVLFGGLLLAAVVFLRLGPARVLWLLGSLGWNFLVLVALFTAHECVRALAVTCCLSSDSRPPFWELLRVRLLGEAAGVLTGTGPFAAEPARAWLLAKLDRGPAYGYSAAIAELIANSVISATVNVAVAGWVLTTATLQGPVAVLTHVVFWASLVWSCTVTGIVISGVRVLGPFARGLSRLPFAGRQLLRLDLKKVQEVEHAISGTLTGRPAALARVILLELAAQAILVCEVYWAIRSMGVAISGRSALFLEVMTRAVSTFQVMGATDVGFAVVFTWLGMPGAIGFTLSLTKTLRSLAVAAVGIGVLTVANRARTALVPTPRPRGAVLGSTILAVAAAAILRAGGQPASDLGPALDAVLARDLRFSPADVVDLERGKIVKHTLAPAAPHEVGVVGAVRVRGSRDRLVAAYRDIVTFKKSAAVLAIGRFGDPPNSSDLDGLTTSHDDFDLRGCKVADCDIRLPATEIQRIATTIDWREPDADARASALFKEILFANVRSYVTGEPGRITRYDDGRTPVLPVIAGDELIRTSPYLDTLKPGLAAHAICLWSNPLDGAEDFLYWTKEKFGLAPLISVTHVTIVPAGLHQSLATGRDVYSSRYIDGSLSTMIASDSAADPRSFYLVYVNRTRVSALSGVMAGLRRTIVEHKAKVSLENYLREVKARIEAH
jgi:hypothetical protein